MSGCIAVALTLPSQLYFCGLLPLSHNLNNTSLSSHPGMEDVTEYIWIAKKYVKISAFNCYAYMMYCCQHLVIPGSISDYCIFCRRFRGWTLCRMGEFTTGGPLSTPHTCSLFLGELPTPTQLQWSFTGGIAGLM